MRLIRLLAIIPCFGLGLPQQTPNREVWEKPIAPGLIYRMELERETPLMVHALRWSPKSTAISVRPELGGKTVYEENLTKGRTTVTELETQTKAIAAINADFFPFTGLPLGLTVRSGELLTTPNAKKRATFGWGPNASGSAIPSFTGKIDVSGGGTLSINAVNQECAEGELVLNTPSAGIAIGKKPCTVAIIRLETGRWMPSTITTAVVESFAPDQERLSIPPNKAILVARGAKAVALTKVRIGSKLTINLQTSGFDWEKIDHVVGGGPILVRNGVESVDGQQEDFPKDSFVDRRHPRTAIGKTSDGDLWFVVVDGRHEWSRGASLSELAKIMLRLGCDEAINLDGGGSSQMNLFGVPTNRPSDAEERPVANGIVFVPNVATTTRASRYRIAGPTKLDVGKDIDLSVLASTGQRLPNASILWSCVSPSAWIDQGGRLHGIEGGKAKIGAYVEGLFLTAEVTVNGPKKPIKPDGEPRS